MSIDLIRDIKNAMESEIATELGASYSKLMFVQDVSKNNFRTNADRYGVRALGAAQADTVTKFVTITQTFEVVLTKAWGGSSLDDSERTERSLDNQCNQLAIYKRFVNGKVGLPGVVLNVNNLFMDEPEFVENEKVVVQRSSVEITYRFSLI